MTAPRSILVALCAACGLAKAEVTLRLQPDAAAGKDAHTQGGGNADKNFATGGNLHLQENHAYTDPGDKPGKYFFKTFIQFDLGKAEGRVKQVSKAELKLFHTGGWGRGDKNWDVFRITEAWQEDTITHNKEPSWDPAFVASVKIGTGQRGEWITWDVTSLVNDWLTGKHPNHGFALMSLVQVPDVHLQFASSDSAEADKRPVLEISYVPKMESLDVRGREMILREWTSASGKTVLARLQGISKGMVVLGNEAESRKIRIKFDGLSDSDKKYLYEVQDQILQADPVKAAPASPATAAAHAGAVIPPQSIRASGSSRLSPADNLVSGKGFDQPSSRRPQTHGRDASAMWMSKGGPIAEQYLLLDLGKLHQVAWLELWPYGVSANSKNSLNRFNLYGHSEDNTANLQLWTRLDGGSGLALAEPEPAPAQLKPSRFVLDAAGPVRYLLIDIQSNHHATDEHVGLSKIRIGGRSAN